MSNTVKVIFRAALPGNLSRSVNRLGQPQPTKTMVIAEVTTLNVTSGLETFTAQDLGLDTIDMLIPRINGGGTGGVPDKSATDTVNCDWDKTNNRFVISDVTGATGARAAITNGEDPVIMVWAVGDSSTAPELA